MQKRAAYYGLAIVTLLNFLNYVDRYILAAVLPRMQSELRMTNTQAGLLATMAKEDRTDPVRRGNAARSHHWNDARASIFRSCSRILKFSRKIETPACVPLPVAAEEAK